MRRYPPRVGIHGAPVAGLTNWAGNHAYVAARLHEPESIEQLQEIVRSVRSLRVLGSRHSFNDIADTTGDLVSLRRMPRVFDLDPVAGTVTVDGGVRYGELCGPLDAAGFALHNLASLPHISVAGACATATHGSGDRSGNLATAVSAMEVVTADGEIAVFARDRDPDAFDGAVVSLGGLGVVTTLTLDLQPTFRMRQDLYEDLPLARVVDHFDEITLDGGQREPVHRMARADLRAGLAQAPGRRMAIRSNRPPTCSARPARRSRSTRSGGCRPQPARSSWASRVRGTSGCRTSGWTTPRAAAPSSRAST